MKKHDPRFTDEEMLPLRQTFPVVTKTGFPDEEMLVVTKTVIIGLLAVAIIVLFFRVLFLYSFHDERITKQTYHAWTNFHGRSISYEDWRLLNRKHLLPGQFEQVIKPVLENAGPAY